jgi:hypothetical protein
MALLPFALDGKTGMIHFFFQGRMFSSNPKMKTTGRNEPRSVPVPPPAAGPSGPYDDMPPLEPITPPRSGAFPGI